MATPAVTIEALPAGYGDSVLVTCTVGTKPWRLLIDTGPDERWPSLKSRLSQIPPERTGKRHIDLAVISHIDHDHIGGAHLLFDDQSLGLTFGDIWFNAPSRPGKRGVAEGQSLASLLGATNGNLPWNKAWGGKSAVTTDEAPFVELAGKAGKPRITLLSPDPVSLAKLFKVWDAELQRLGQSETPEPGPAVSRGQGLMDLEALARKTTPKDHAPANGSSIAFLLEHQGVSVLLAADAHPTVLVPALNALAAHRGIPLPLRVDAFKLSHHGSRANVTVDLLQAVQAQHYIVSTNGAIFNHPDDEAIARVIVDGGTGRTVWFNYRTEHTSKWGADELQQRYGYLPRLPEAGRDGVTISLEEQKSKR